jgi:kynureninase
MERVAALRPELEIVTPREPRCRGSQVAIVFDQGYPVVQAMIARGVIGDFRAPDMMRFGFAPAYLRFQDVWVAAEILADCMRAEVWHDARYRKRGTVT